MEFFEKYAKRMQFLQFAKEDFSKFSKILLCPGGSAPGPATRPVITLNPRTFFHAYATDSEVNIVIG